MMKAAPLGCGLTFASSHNLKSRWLESVKANVDVLQPGLLQVSGATSKGDAVGRH
jgi:hypothetical protein